MNVLVLNSRLTVRVHYMTILVSVRHGLPRFSTNICRILYTVLRIIVVYNKIVNLNLEYLLIILTVY